MRILPFALALLIAPQAFGQLGGTRAFAFLDLPSTARISATGGNLIVVKDDDPGLAFQNPSLLNAQMHRQLTASSVIFPGKINFGYAGYAHDFEDQATGHLGMQYVAYGQFDETDVTGRVTGTAIASDFALLAGGSQQYEKYSYGANVKLLYSQLETYSAFGAAFDLAGTFHDTARLFTAALVVKNIGLQFKPYVKGKREPLPFEIQLGISKKMAKAPFRISIIAHNLQQFNLRYEDNLEEETSTLLVSDTTQQTKAEKHIFDKIARHFIVSSEIYLGKVITLRIGYNHLRRKELSLSTKGGLTGISFGVGLKIKMLRIDYGFAKYHLGGASNHFTVTANLNEFMHR